LSSVLALGDEHPSFHDLVALADEVRREYFPEENALPVRWGHRIRRKRRRSIRLGSYNNDTNEIRIHPLLDSPTVPRTFIQSIIHHEYLHHILGADHDRRFRRHERMFRYFREADMWLKKNLHELLGRRKRTPRAPVAPEPFTAPLPFVKPIQLSLF
jgi:hypothetical protein